MGAVRLAPFAGRLRCARTADPHRSADIAYRRLLLVLADDRLRCAGPDWIIAHWRRIARRRGSWAASDTLPP